MVIGKVVDVKGVMLMKVVDKYFMVGRRSDDGYNIDIVEWRGFILVNI